MVSESVIYERSHSLVARDLAGEKVIVPVRGKVGDLNCIYTLNPVANEIWQLLDGKLTTGEIAGALQQQYEIDEATLRGDVRRLLEEMEQEGLVRRV